jgi:hypothetical protein
MELDKTQNFFTDYNRSKGSETMNGSSRDHLGSKYKILEQPLGSIKPVRIICIGAGASGINMAYQTRQHLKNVELTIYEKNPDVGGTWYENRYPGCRCDVRKFHTILWCGFRRAVLTSVRKLLIIINSPGSAIRVGRRSSRDMQKYFHI